MNDESIIAKELIVWVIDDDLVSLFATRYGIEQSDGKCKVVDFDSGEMALKIFSDCLDHIDHAPDIILLDLVMPSMNGWEFLEKLDEIGNRPKKTDVYIISAFTNSKDRIKAKGHPSVMGYFDKPLSKESINRIFIGNKNSDITSK